MGIPIKDYTYQNILFVHNFIFIFLIFIFCIILCFYSYILLEYSYNQTSFNMKFYMKLLRFNKLKKYSHSKLISKIINYINVGLNKRHNLSLEVFWTFVPIVIILELIFPSISLIADDEIDTNSSSHTVSVIGNQWYWNYEINTGSITKQISSNLINLEEGNKLHKNLTRLLATTESVMVPVGVKTSFYITSNDVIHSWAIPGLGIKIDAIPGRLNYKNIMTTRLGLYSGMCSELCGIDHGFMPISLKSLTYPNFIYILGMEKVVVKREELWAVI